MSANTNSLMERLPCSMVERIDYGQEASLSKVRHEHSVFKDRRRVHYCRTGCWCLQGHAHPHVFTASPHTMKDATGVPPERPFIYVSGA